MVYRNGVELESHSGSFDHATNNVAELTGILKALQWIAPNAPGEDVILFSDSMYCVQGATEWLGRWKAKGWARGGHKAKEKNRTLANVELWKAIDLAMIAAPNAAIRWCKGHAGIRGNEAADRLATQAMQSGSIDPGDPADGDWLTREYRSIMRVAV